MVFCHVMLGTVGGGYVSQLGMRWRGLSFKLGVVSRTCFGMLQAVVIVQFLYILTSLDMW